MVVILLTRITHETICLLRNGAEVYHGNRATTSAGDGTTFGLSHLCPPTRTHTAGFLVNVPTRIFEWLLAEKPSGEVDFETRYHLSLIMRRRQPKKENLPDTQLTIVVIPRTLSKATSFFWWALDSSNRLLNVGCLVTEVACMDAMY